MSFMGGVRAPSLSDKYKNKLLMKFQDLVVHYVYLKSSFAGSF